MAAISLGAGIDQDGPVFRDSHAEVTLIPGESGFSVPASRWCSCSPR